MRDITEKQNFILHVCIAAFGHKTVQEHGPQLSRSCHSVRKTQHTESEFISEHYMNYSGISHESKLPI